MSRIGKKPIIIPDQVEVTIDKDRIKVKGPKGELTEKIHPFVKIDLQDKQMSVLPDKKTKSTSALWGLFRALIANMVLGVTEGFEKKLEIQGVGFRAQVQGKDLILHLGLSHPVEVAAPEGIEIKVEKNIITISGTDKQLVGQIAAKIRALKKPEPYKGKGIRYMGEVVRIKAGKKAGGTTS